MKKIMHLFTALFLAASLLASTASAANDLKLEVNGDSVSFQYGTPFIDNGRSLVPLRDLLISLGVQNDDEHIIWNGSEQSVTAIMNDKTVKLSVGSKEIYLNGKLHKTLEVPAQNVSGRVYLPARAVAEAFGFHVGFNPDTWTILVQETPFGGGVKADDYENEDIAAGVESLQLALDAYADGATLRAETLDVLNQHSQAFFAADRSPLSLDDAAQAVSVDDIARNVSAFADTVVNLTFVELDSVRELQLENGQTITGAVGHTGGEYRELTETWEDSTYFQLFFLGSADVAQGDKVTVNGVPVGETTVELVNALGVPFTEPMYIIVAGNLLSAADEYDIRKERSESNPGTISIPELDAEVQKKLDRLTLTLTADGLKIFDPYLNGMEVKSVQIEDFTFTPSAKTTIPNDSYDGLTVPLSSFVNDSGKPFAAQSGSFFVKITTNLGETFQFVDFQ